MKSISLESTDGGELFNGKYIHFSVVARVWSRFQLQTFQKSIEIAKYSTVSIRL
jgi:hypothetical protein